jgi:restriction system protein
VDESRWLRAVDVFIDEHIEKSGCRIKASPALLRVVRATIDLATIQRDTSRATRQPDRTPTAYEQSVADALRVLGWRTRLTGAGEDRHFDVIAQMRDKRVMVQCSGFVSPVRAAVIHDLDSARIRAGADHVAIVSNAKFTPEARDLATLTGVLILRHDTLAQLAARIFGNPRRSSASMAGPDDRPPDGVAATSKVMAA